MAKEMETILPLEHDGETYQVTIAELTTHAAPALLQPDAAKNRPLCALFVQAINGKPATEFPTIIRTLAGALARAFLVTSLQPLYDAMNQTEMDGN